MNYLDEYSKNPGNLRKKKVIKVGHLHAALSLYYKKEKKYTIETLPQ